MAHVQAQEGAVTAAVDTAVNTSTSWADMAAVATTNRACVVSYSLVTPTQLQIGVIASRDGSLACFTTAELADDVRSLEVLVEAARRTMGARARSAPAPARRRRETSSPGGARISRACVEATQMEDKSQERGPKETEAHIEALRATSKDEGMLLQRFSVCHVNLFILVLSRHSRAILANHCKQGFRSPYFFE